MAAIMIRLTFSGIIEPLPDVDPSQDLYLEDDVSVNTSNGEDQ